MYDRSSFNLSRPGCVLVSVVHTRTGWSPAVSRYPAAAWTALDMSGSAFEMCTGRLLTSPAVSRHPVVAYLVPDTLGSACRMRTGWSLASSAVSRFPAAACVVPEFTESATHTWAVSVWPRPGTRVSVSVPDHAFPPPLQRLP